MAEKKNTSPPAKKTPVPETDEACETNTGNAKKDGEKPDCPEGYPDEQANDQSKAKK